MSNESNMTPAERLAQKIKESPFADFFTEDEITAVAKAAIEKAFFTDQTTGSGYNATRRDPVIVEIAREAFKKAFEPLAKAAAEKIAESDEFRAALMAASVAMLPDIIINGGRSIAGQTAASYAASAANTVIDMIKHAAATPGGMANLSSGALQPRPHI